MDVLLVAPSRCEMTEMVFCWNFGLIAGWWWGSCMISDAGMLTEQREGNRAHGLTDVLTNSNKQWPRTSAGKHVSVVGQLWCLLTYYHRITRILHAQEGMKTKQLLMQIFVYRCINDMTAWCQVISILHPGVKPNKTHTQTLSTQSHGHRWFSILETWLLTEAFLHGHHVRLIMLMDKNPAITLQHGLFFLLAGFHYMSGGSPDFNKSTHQQYWIAGLT